MKLASTQPSIGVLMVPEFIYAMNLSAAAVQRQYQVFDITDTAKDYQNLVAPSSTGVGGSPWCAVRNSIATPGTGGVLDTNLPGAILMDATCAQYAIGRYCVREQSVQVLVWTGNAAAALTRGMFGSASVAAAPGTGPGLTFAALPAGTVKVVAQLLEEGTYQDTGAGGNKTYGWVWFDGINGIR